MTNPAPQRKGRRNPALLQPDGDTGPEIDLSEEHADEQEMQPDGTEFRLLDEGDIVTVSMTMPVLLEGHARETYINAKATTRVREDEHAEISAARARGLVLGSILDQIDEAEEALRQYAERQAQMLARAGVRQ